MIVLLSNGGSLTSVHQLRHAIDASSSAYNQDALPFQWRKAEVHPKHLASRITERPARAD
jgi:hypothetical protein